MSVTVQIVQRAFVVLDIIIISIRHIDNGSRLRLGDSQAHADIIIFVLHPFHLAAHGDFRIQIRKPQGYRRVFAGVRQLDIGQVVLENIVRKVEIARHDDRGFFPPLIRERLQQIRRLHVLLIQQTHIHGLAHRGIHGRRNAPPPVLEV